MAPVPKKFCRITKYIEKTDPKLYEILDDLCMLGSFRPRRGHNGTTFIYPSKDTISKLDKIRFTDDIDKGCDVVLAHIVHDYLPNAAAWSSKKNDIPNGLNRKLEVKSVTGAKVTLVDGAELEHDDNFKTFRTEGETQSVWRIKSGNLDPTKHTKQATLEHARQGAPQRPNRTEGGHGPAWSSAVGGSLISSIMGGNGRPAVAPFGMLVAFSEYVHHKGDQKAVNELRIVLSTEMITTTAFVSREGSVLKELLDEFRTSPDAKSVKHGKDRYLKLVEESHAALASAKKGGGKTLEEFNDSLAQAFKACRASSERALAGFDLHSSFTADTFTALNLSRAMEFECLSKLPKDEQLFVDKAGEIRELIEVIEGRAAGHRGLETDVASQSLGQLIASVFVAVDKFRKNSPYKTYPFGAKAQYAAGKKQCDALYGPDNSLSGQLAKLSPDELSELFSNLAPAEEREEIREEAREERDEAVEAPES